MIDNLADLMGQIMIRAAELSESQDRGVGVSYNGEDDTLTVRVWLHYEGIELPEPVYTLADRDEITGDLLTEILDRLNAWAELEVEILLDNIALMQVAARRITCPWIWICGGRCTSARGVSGNMTAL